jgi:hypothetical protein
VASPPEVLLHPPDFVPALPVLLPLLAAPEVELCVEPEPDPLEEPTPEDEAALDMAWPLELDPPPVEVALLPDEDDAEDARELAVEVDAEEVELATVVVAPPSVR